jgi:hypothetical protein
MISTYALQRSSRAGQRLSQIFVRGPIGSGNGAADRDIVVQRAKAGAKYRQSI